MSGTSEDRRQVPKEVSDILNNGQTQAEYRAATPEEARRYKDRTPTTPYHDRLILVSGPNANKPEEERKLPSHINLSDGSILILLTTTPPRVIDPKKHMDKPAQMYADMFLYVPWQDEEVFFGEASRSVEAWQAL